MKNGVKSCMGFWRMSRLARTKVGEPSTRVRVKISPVRWASRVALIEFAVVVATAYLASFLYHELVYNSSPRASQYILASALLGSFHVLISFVDDQYRLAGDKWSHRGISRGAGAVTLAFVFFLALSFLFKVAEDYSRGTFLSQIAAVIPALVLARIVIAEHFKRSFRAGTYQARGIVVLSLDGNDSSTELAEKICETPDRIVKWNNLDSGQLGPVGGDLPDATAARLSKICSECRKLRADAVVIVFDAINLDRIARVVEAFYALPADIQLLPVSIAPFMRRSRISQSGQVRLLELTSGPSSLMGRFLKRAFDLVVASLAVIVLSPLLLLVSLAIKLESRGPVLFRQTRHGFNNEPIQVLKFRTMVSDNNGTLFRQATKNDPRVTRIGRLLRRTNVDELPQLFNVISGEMSLVGPRPHAVEHNDSFFGQIKLMARRHNMKPGITGWAQVNGLRGETDTCEKMMKRIDYDLYYIDNWSFFFDVKILFMTLLSRKAYTNAI
jgi:Undecaprenyl-phosphate glucose phosphotransferase